MASNTLFSTFYSYKGGVGRTLTLVNTAVTLTQKGHSVIIWDMDIEAPGIQNIPYFGSMRDKIRAGFVDIALDFKKRNYKGVDDELLSSCLVTHPKNPKLRLLPAGDLKKGSNYPEKFTAIDWNRLFGKGKNAGFVLFELIREELLKYHADFVLIDSRTGITDIGGVCCIQLPDVVFLMFSYGNQNLNGIRGIHNSLTNTDNMQHLRSGRPLPVHLIASMVPEDRPELFEERKKEWQTLNLNPRADIPYNSEVAFTETIWADKYPDHKYCAVYEDIVTILNDEKNSIAPVEERNLNPESADRLLKERGLDKYEKGNRFEQKSAELFKLMGFKAELDLRIAGSQIDIMITKSNSLETTSYIVECKDWERNVGKEIVDQVENNLKAVSGCDNKYSACRAIIVSKTGFTKEAKSYAGKLNITLRSYDELLNSLIDFASYISYIKTLYAGRELEKNYIEQDVIVEGRGESQPLLDYINDEWLQKSGGGFFTLLGDFGTGKTSFTKRLAHDLAVKYEKNKTTNRVPVLINLKDAHKALSLENIIFEHFSKNAGLNASPETLLHLLREGKIVILFDGFDEMATQSNAALTMQNFRELNKAFVNDARVILTCRTHYFRDRSETDETLLSEKKENSREVTELYKAITGREGYEIGYLQEFKQEQIESYLKKTLADKWIKAKETIGSIYNLKDLSSRPVLLDMIIKSLPKIREQKGGFRTADLYAAFVQIWIEREDWRFELTRDGKEMLVEELALRLWQTNSVTLHHSHIDGLLKNYLKEKKIDVQLADVEFALSEVRTASFLTRDDDGNYGFGHRSFMEFFLARRLAKELDKGKVECLDIRRLSKEVVLFLSQTAEKENLVKITKGILSGEYRKMVSENCLLIFYWLYRYELRADGSVDPENLMELLSKNRPDEINLPSAELEAVELPYMDLSHANLENANLQSSILNHCRFEGSTLKNANIKMSTMSHAHLEDANLQGLSSSHVSFRNAYLNNANLNDADLSASNFLKADLRGVSMLNSNLSHCGMLKSRTDKGMFSNLNCYGMGKPETRLLEMEFVIQIGHSGLVSSVSFSPDGTMLASGSYDKTIKLWDIQRKKELADLKGHSGWVSSVSFSPDGRVLASGSYDKTIKLWDIQSKKELANLKGHSGWVNSVSFSPDGRMIASGSNDNTIKLWDIQSKKELTNLKGHLDLVNSVSFSPDGRILASGSYDDTIKLWDTKSKKEVAYLKGHSDWVNSVSFSSDGRVLASGSFDNTIKLWDTKSKKELADLKGHSGGVSSVSFSPDRRMLASGSYDNTIKLWDTKSKKELATLKGHSLSVFSVTFSPDGKRIICGSSEGVSIYNINMEAGKGITCEFVATLFHLPDNEWAAVDPANRYVCSEGGRKQITFSDNLALYEAYDIPELEQKDGLFENS